MKTKMDVLVRILSCLIIFGPFAILIIHGLIDACRPNNPGWDCETPFSWSDFAYAYGYTALKVALAIAVLAVAKPLWHRIRQKTFATPVVAPADAISSLPVQPQYLINKHQKIILVITGLVMVVMLLFPPFHIMREGHEVMAVGYHFGLQLKNSYGGYEDISVDRELLRIQLIVTFVVGAIGVLLVHTRKAPKST